MHLLLIIAVTAGAAALAAALAGKRVGKQPVPVRARAKRRKD
ncbi:MAG: hypothetical protein ABSA13_02720 [Beijerinckiaceae bacterium]|jgi:hypothetical protein